MEGHTEGRLDREGEGGAMRRGACQKQERTKYIFLFLSVESDKSNLRCNLYNIAGLKLSNLTGHFMFASPC